MELGFYPYSVHMGIINWRREINPMSDKSYSHNLNLPSFGNLLDDKRVIRLRRVALHH